MEQLEGNKEFITQDDVTYYGPQDCQETENGEIRELGESDMEKYTIVKDYVVYF